MLQTLYILLIILLLLPLNVVIASGFGEFIFDPSSPIHKIPPKYDDIVTGVTTLYIMLTMILVDVAITFMMLSILP